VNRASVIGEFGGAGFPIPGHLWNPNGPFSDEQDLPTAATQQPWIVDRLGAVRKLATDGISAAVYTQLSDVDNEVNGFLTYDRTTDQKADPAAIKQAARRLYPFPDYAVAVPDAKDQAEQWRYTLQQPPMVRLQFLHSPPELTPLLSIAIRRWAARGLIVGCWISWGQPVHRSRPCCAVG
jgi:hypothetical protein